jgi:hypothetical protein
MRAFPSLPGDSNGINNTRGASNQFMNERVEPKMANFCVVKLSNSLAKAGPMSGANASPQAPTFGGSYLRSTP